MGKIEILNNFANIANNELLGLDDYEGIVEISIPEISSEKYTLEIPSKIKFEYGGHNASHPSKQITVLLDTLKKVRVPAFKGATTVDLVKSWVLPMLYIEQARNYNLYSYQDYSEYQRTVAIYNYIVGIYKNLIADLLKYFVPEARDIVRCLMLRETVCYAVSAACLDLENGLCTDIKYHSSSMSNAPKELFASWESLIGLTSALAVESQYYEQVYAAYQHRKYRRQIHKGEIYTKELAPLNPSNHEYKNHSAISRMYKLSKVNKELSDFYHAHRKNYLLPKASDADNSITSRGTKDDYISVYVSPKNSILNSIDQDIVIIEKELVAKIELSRNSNLLNINMHDDLLLSVKKAMNLISLMRMRYIMYLNARVSWYFFMFESEKNVNLKQYFKIFEFYLESIVAVLLDLVQIASANQSNTLVLNYYSEITDVLNDYLYEINGIDDSIAGKTRQLLLGLTEKISNDNSNLQVEHLNISFLRKRKTHPYRTG